jgi:hypothetical protein
MEKSIKKQKGEPIFYIKFYNFLREKKKKKRKSDFWKFETRDPQKRPISLNFAPKSTIFRSKSGQKRQKNTQKHPKNP